MPVPFAPSAPPAHQRPRWVVAAIQVGSLLLLACAPIHGHRLVPGRYAQGFDSASASCRSQPGLCVRAVGEQTVIPGAGQRLAEFGASLAPLASAISLEQKAHVERVLSECANEARGQVLLEHLGGRSPTPEECREEKNFGGRVRSRARFFGEEMHRAAFQCVQARLSVPAPGGFLLEPRYRYDPGTGRRELISTAQEEHWLKDGCFGELEGTLKPDIVIHAGDPLQPRAVYDFKFPCVHTVDTNWCFYTRGPHEGRWQNHVYKEALGPDPLKIVPRIGVTR